MMEKFERQADKDPDANEKDSTMPAEYPDPGIEFPSGNQKNM